MNANQDGLQNGRHLQVGKSLLSPDFFQFI